LKVSIVIPIYNGEAYLRQALESIAAQTIQDFEVIAVDDASLDATLKILREWTAFPINIIHYSENKGIAGSVNDSVAVADGQFFACLNSDDMWLPNKLATELRFFQVHPHLDVVYSDFNQLLPNGQTRLIRCADFNAARLKRECLMNISSTMIRMSTLKDLSEVFNPAWMVKYCTDWDLWRRLAEHNANFMHIPEVLSVYRIHGKQGNVSTKGLVYNWIYYTQKNGLSLTKTATTLRAILRGVKNQLWD
jgi:glycosyltransferase involved in cell wall biosynthesis